MEIACIVEGHGEEIALPLLLRRIIEEFDPQLAWTIQIHPPIRRPRTLLSTRDAFTRVFQFAARQVSRPGAVLVLLDADDDCPATLGPSLLEWAHSAHRAMPVSAVLANVEFEAWFLAAAASLRGHRGLSETVEPPTDPEVIQGAKEWLTRHMPPGRPYSPTDHQASFCSVMSLEEARQAASFDKLCRDVRRLVQGMQPSER